MKKKRVNKRVNKRMLGILKFCMLIALNVLIQVQPLLAASEITSGIGNLRSIASAFVTAVGAIIVLWGIFEWGNAMQSNDGMMQSAAFKRIGGGLVMVIAPQLLNAIVT